MAEERISVHICSKKCRCLREVKEGYSIVNGLSNGTYCSAYYHGNWQKIDPEKDCKNCKRAEYNGMTVGEAIEFMAVAMCQKSNRTNKCENCISAAKGDCDLKSYYPLAEAALEALIKAKEKINEMYISLIK